MPCQSETNRYSSGYGRIMNRSEYKEVLFELAGDKKRELALKMVNGNAKTKPKIRTTGV